MPEALGASSLLREAAVYFDARHNGLAQSAPAAGKRGFASSGEWMREALRVIRQNALPAPALNFQTLGLVKYGLALLAAAGMVAAALWQNSPWLALLAPLAFYAVEAQMVFLFPLAIDGSADALRESRVWTKRAGGTVRVMTTVMPLAAAMLLGGFAGRGFVRSWCLGCLAVLIWYERLRTVPNRPRASRSILEIGATQPLSVRQESVRLFHHTQPVRLLYASDLHFRGGSSHRVAAQLITAVRESTPDLILLGGDLVDTKHGLELLSGTVRELTHIAPVWAIAGNHDALVGVAAVQSTVEQAGGSWLGNRSLSFTKPGLPRALVVDGVAKNIAATQPTILCAHDPAIFPDAVRRGYGLVLAGHLHGGQFVVSERSGRLLPGAWFYRWNGLRFTEGETTMLVSRGVSDTLPLRWNCPREILLCEIS